MPKTSSYWMCTYTGKQFWPDEPDPKDVCIEDIAHALAIESRFGGHLPRPYSVAQHSVLASSIVERMGGNRYDQLCALLHDAAEAYLKDIPRPLKKLLGSTYAILTRKVETAIREHFGLQREWSSLIRRADEVCLTVERRCLFPSSHQQIWTLGGNEADSFGDEHITYLDWQDAEAVFHARFASLT